MKIRKNFKKLYLEIGGNIMMKKRGKRIPAIIIPFAPEIIKNSNAGFL